MIFLDPIAEESKDEPLLIDITRTLVDKKK